MGTLYSIGNQMGTFYQELWKKRPHGNFCPAHDLLIIMSGNLFLKHRKFSDNTSKTISLIEQPQRLKPRDPLQRPSFPHYQEIINLVNDKISNNPVIWMIIVIFGLNTQLSLWRRAQLLYYGTRTQYRTRQEIIHDVHQHL